MRRQVISPAQIELLRDCLRQSSGRLKVFFEIVDEASPFADYVAEIVRRDDGLFGYTLGGHGIGSNTRQPVSLDSTIERVLQDNGRFNSEGLFTFEVL